MDFLYSIFGGITVHPITLSAIVSLTISLILLCISAIISASEVAFFSLDPQTLDELEDSENKADHTILRLLKTPQRLLATMLIGNNFVNMAVILLLTYFTTRIINFENAPVFGFVFQTILITFAILLIGEIMPKVFATQNAKKNGCKYCSFFVGT